MTLDTVNLEDALRLLSLPRVVGVDTATSEDITAQNGRYGPYLMRGADSRSLTDEAAIFTVTLEQALALYAQPKQRRGRGQAAAPIREVGNDPTTGKPIVVREGRFGLYVTDGETNASLRTADDPTTISVDRASDLLSERRSRISLDGGVKKTTKRVVKKGTSKAAKKAATKRTAKKPNKKAVKRAALAPAGSR
jgi:DNA topoisomerase-1